MQGPDLSGVGNKFAPKRNPDGPDWLYSWIKEPTRYHARTVMPNLFLEPEMIAGADPNEPGRRARRFDPADDIATYLLVGFDRPIGSRSPQRPAASKPLDADGTTALKDLMLEYLNEAFYQGRRRADYLRAAAFRRRWKASSRGPRRT